tara:strand:- start:46 stop:285 length:240 start_codon:yes stop_codon:yes gene_type:complete
MSWQVILKDASQIEVAINNGIHDKSDYSSETANKFERFLQKKYNDKNIVVEYIEDDKAFYIDFKNNTYKFDMDGKFTKE